MTFSRRLLFLLPLIAGLASCQMSDAGAGDPPPGAFEWPEPSMENRPGCYWWWMGSAVDRKNITRNLEMLQAAGLGGCTIVPIYGVKGCEDGYIKHLTPEWVAMMSHAVAEAGRLGMWIDMTSGTGWPFGGPMISGDDCDAAVVYEEGELSWKFSGRNVKRAAPGGEGRAINPYSPAAMKAYLAHFDRAFDREGVDLPRAMYHDSFEFRGNWCPRFMEEFEKRRGYDLRPHLPALFGEGDEEKAARIKCDYRETLADLHLEYLEAWVEWSGSKGCTTRNQAHGSPSNLLDLYAACGIPETETFGATSFGIPGIRRDEDNVRRDFPQPLINRMASSAAHVSGKPLVAAEACTWVRNHFRAALSQVKPEIDQLFLNGINHIFFHGSCYSPVEAPWPGWLFYASLQYNPRNAIWRDAPCLNAYITRCQSILQSGSPDNDLALYWPVHDIWQNPRGMQQQLTVHHAGWLVDSACGRTAAWLAAEGYGFDFISDRQILAGRAQAFRAVLVPGTGHLPLATLKKLLDLNDSGLPVLFLESLPADVPGFLDPETRRSVLKELLRGRDGLAVEQDDLYRRLAAAGVLREPMTDRGLDFIRRTHGRGHHYFVANMGAESVDGWIPLGAAFESAVLLDPRSGDIGKARMREGNSVFLQLLPGETRFIRTFRDVDEAGPEWPAYRKSGDPPITVAGPWQVVFLDGGPVLPASFTTARLESWTDLGGDEAGRFAGTARYTIEFDLPREKVADEWMLDLGDVRESARVKLNGNEVAALWSVPYCAKVGDHLVAGLNRLEVEVTNLSANRIRDLDRRGVKWRIFHDINFVDHNYRPFDASQWPVAPSGLLGPVTLVPMKESEP